MIKCAIIGGEAETSYRELWPVVIVGLLTGLSVSAFYGLLEFLSASLRQFLPLPISALISLPSACLIARALSGKKKGGSGVDAFLENYHMQHGKASLRSTLGNVLSSLATISLGGSAGPEGPGLMLGGGLGSWLARRFCLDPERMRRLYITGAAAGIAAIFRAPLTGTVFALEIPYMYDVETGVFIWALVSVIISYTVTIIFLGTEQLFPFQSGTIAFSPGLMVNSIAIGLLSAIVAILFIKFFRLSKGLAKRVPGYALPVAGGLILALIGLFFPEVLGAGYETIRGIGAGAFGLTIYLAFALMIMKVVATSVTLSSGGSGGLFVPLIYVGAALGSFYSIATGQPDRVVIIAAAVAGVFAAANKTLLTSILLVSETFGPVVLLPSIVAATISFLITKDQSIHENQLPRKATKKEMAIEMFHQKFAAFLKDMKVEAVMTTNPSAIDAGMTVGEALERSRQLGLREVPVVSGGKYAGYVTLDILLSEPKDQPVSKVLVFSDPAYPDDTLDGLIRRMLNTDETHVYVTDRDSRLVGVVSQSDIIRIASEFAVKEK